MEKVWSFNTTIRNPERIEQMLRVLVELEGVEFDERGQELFFGLQIKKRLYKPTDKTLQEDDLISLVNSDILDNDLEDEIVERILEKYRGRSVDGAGRGRTAAGIMNRLGLCIALQSKGSVIVTDTAKKWLNHEIDDEELFSKFFLKWQYPNHIEKGYKNFNIKPFISTIILIKCVNKKWEALHNKPVGLSKYEYSLFVPSLCDASKIEEYANNIIKYRIKKESKAGIDKVRFMKEFAAKRIIEIYGLGKKLETALNDLRDYTDSSIRYFRMSGLIVLRGGDSHIDIAQNKDVEIESLLNSISPFSNNFETYESYFEYLSNIKALDLPWENESDLRRIGGELIKLVSVESGEEDISDYVSKVKALPVNKMVSSLEEKLNQLRINKLRELKHNIDVLDECIEKISCIIGRNYEALTSRPSLDLEWYVSCSLMVLNDALQISPSFNIGDDGIPTGFRSNVSDIECYYETFGMTVEVTLMVGRDQWVAEGQPVMRHFRDFEDKLDKDLAYCIFIAPHLHRDTLNTFWMSNKYNYEGKKQNIIPITINQFLEILEISREKIKQKNLNHISLNNLFNSIISRVDEAETSSAWLGTFSDTVKDWSISK